MPVGNDEFEIGVCRAGARDHFGREVDADSMGRLERRKQVATAATHLDHPPGRADEVAIDRDQASPVEDPEATEVIFTARQGVPVCDASRAKTRRRGAGSVVSGGGANGADAHPSAR